MGELDLDRKTVYVCVGGGGGRGGRGESREGEGGVESPGHERG